MAQAKASGWKSPYLAAERKRGNNNHGDDGDSNNTDDGDVGKVVAGAPPDERRRTSVGDGSGEGGSCVTVAPVGGGAGGRGTVAAFDTVTADGRTTAD